MRKYLILYLLGFTTLMAAPKGEQPNPPHWPKGDPWRGGVFIFEPEDENAQEIVNQISRVNGWNLTLGDNGQFSPNRYALFFKPGNYSKLTVPVGYYTSIYGLGRTPKETQIFEVLCQQASFYTTVGALNTFWRSAENFTMRPTQSHWRKGPIGMLWAVSQATPLRRVHLEGPNGNLLLFQKVPPLPEAGWASGGFFADSEFSGEVLSGSQQQWLARNSVMKRWKGSDRNMVFVGCKGAPATHCGKPTAFTNVEKTEIIAEKPYIIVDENDKFSLVLPRVEYNKIGSTQFEKKSSDKIIPFEEVYVASAEKDDASSINKMIAQGYHVVLAPGIYELDESIKIDQDGICLLGLGFATLVSMNGNSCIEVGDSDDVRIAAILLQAGTKPTKRLLRWGEVGDEPRRGFLYDCFARVGGPTSSRVEPVTADVMVEINSANIVCDNLWLWRADHDVGGIVIGADNPCHTALVANGENIVIYGLASEHTLQDLVQWNGENGRVYFFQSEYPYDVTQKQYGDPGYVGYRVHPKVQKHHGWGIGIYSFFRDHDVTVKSGICAPEGDDIQFTNALTSWLAGYGRILHVINEEGKTVDKSNPGPVYICDFPKD